MVTFYPIDFWGADPLEFPNFYCKYAPIDVVRSQENRLVNRLLNCAPIRGGRKYVTVDVKVQHLDIGETTCKPGWHCDTPTDPRAVHSLFIIGDNRTEFNGPVAVQTLPYDCFAQYGNDDEHRGPEVLVSETRFLLRVTESDVVRGQINFRDEYPYRFPVDPNTQ